MHGILGEYVAVISAAILLVALFAVLLARADRRRSNPRPSPAAIRRHVAEFLGLSPDDVLVTMTATGGIRVEAHCSMSDGDELRRELERFAPEYRDFDVLPLGRRW